MIQAKALRPLLHGWPWNLPFCPCCVPDIQSGGKQLGHRTEHKPCLQSQCPGALRSSGLSCKGSVPSSSGERPGTGLCKSLNRTPPHLQLLQQSHSTSRLLKDADPRQHISASPTPKPLHPTVSIPELECNW